MRIAGIGLCVAAALMPFGAIAAPAAAPVPPAIAADPPRDAAHPARMAVLHIPSGGGTLNAVAYVAAGAGPHPTLVLFHGLPGNEKNLDLAQAVRRAGWTVIAPNYRGSWGSPGRFSFAGNLVDADAVLAHIRAPANAAKLGVDPARIVIAGHSMGGWVTAMAAAHDPLRLGAILISAANVGGLGTMSRPELIARMADNRETLTASAEQMADELIAGAPAFDWIRAAPGLAAKPLLLLTSDDGLAPGADALAARVRAAAGGIGRVAPGRDRTVVAGGVESVHVGTDHGWSDARIRLQAEILNWLAALDPAPR